MYNRGRFVIIGSTGLIGSALQDVCKQNSQRTVSLARNKISDEVISFDALNCSIADVINDLSSSDVVFILAAYSDQRWVRENSLESRKLNIDATIRIILECRKANCHIIFLSSEAVFGRNCADAGWAEESTTCPATEYGRQKSEIEDYLLFAPNSCIVRTGWNVGWDPSQRCVIKSTFNSLLNENCLVAVDNSFSLTDVRDTAKCLYLIGRHRISGISHVAGDSIERIKLVHWIMELSKYSSRMSYEEVTHASLRIPENPPNNSCLASSSNFPSLGVVFKSPRDIVVEKVRLLDSIYDVF